MASPPTKNPRTAINEGSCKLLSPDIAWPEVHPPAYLVPNPMNNPPSASNRMLLMESNLKSSVGK